MVVYIKCFYPGICWIFKSDMEKAYYCDWNKCMYCNSIVWIEVKNNEYNMIGILFFFEIEKRGLERCNIRKKWRKWGR